MKKLTALFLALALCLSLCTVTAFAGDTNQVFIVDSSIVGIPGLTSIEIFGDDDMRYKFAVKLGSLEKGTTYSFDDMDKDAVARCDEDFNLEYATDATFKIDANDKIYATMVTQSGTYQISTPITIADILADITNLPQATSNKIPDGAWKASNSNNTCYQFEFIDNMIAFNNGSDLIFTFPSNVSVKKEDGKYTAEDGKAQVTFTMLDNNVVSITFSTTDSNYKSYEGTYTPPVVTHTVNIATPTNGTVTATPTDVASGTDVTLTVTPNAGYKTKSVSVTTAGGANVTVTGSGNTYSFVMPNDNVTVKAVFEKENSGTGGGHHHGGGSTTPTVTAPKTADMGVALYGVLTVSSLLGMGWVSKKKKQ